MTVSYLATSTGWKRVSLPATPPTGGGGGGTTTPTSQQQRNALVMNSYFPDESNTGVLPDVARTTVTSLTLVPGQTYSNLDIKTVLTPPAASGSLAVIFRNCWFWGNSVGPSGETGLVRAYGNNHAPMEFYDCTFQPQTPNWFWIGLHGYGYKVVRCTFRYLVDGFQCFNNNTGHKNDPSGVKIYQSWVGKHAFWENPPDTSHSDGSHADGIQISGNTGYDIQGNTFTGQTYSTWVPNHYGTTQTNSAFMIKPDVSLISGLNIQHNYIGGGAYSINIANSSSISLGNLGTIANNSFGRDQRIQGPGGNSTYTIDMPSTVSGTFTGNVYADNGAPILVRRNG